MCKSRRLHCGNSGIRLSQNLAKSKSSVRTLRTCTHTFWIADVRRRFFLRFLRTRPTMVCAEIFMADILRAWARPIDQCLFFSRNIGQVTPTIVYFHYLKKICFGSNHPKNNLFNFENRSAAIDKQFQFQIDNKSSIIGSEKSSVHHIALTNVAVSAEIALRSPRKLFIFIIKKYIYRIKVSKKINLFN